MSTLPVLVIGFNRPDLLQNLLTRLQELQVTEVYVSLDGPRNDLDIKSCDMCLEVAKRFITFFDTKILYRSYNLGCNLGVVSALDWFFSQVDFGVVIEDDCFPADDLLDQLNKFNQNKINYQKQQVFIATGHNPFLRIKQDSISKYMLIGAWATWAEVWKEVRLNYFKLSLPTTKNIISEKRNLIESVYWWVNSSRAKLGYLDTWDGIFNDKAWNLGFKCLIPENNLVTNFGFRSDGTHTKNNTETNLVNLNNDKYLEINIDKLLIKYYFKIKKYHIVTPVFRLIKDFSKFSKKKNFENILKWDVKNRTVIL
jgi:hypothetical protein